MEGQNPCTRFKSKSMEVFWVFTQPRSRSASLATLPIGSNQPIVGGQNYQKFYIWSKTNLQSNYFLFPHLLSRLSTSLMSTWSDSLMDWVTRTNPSCLPNISPFNGTSFSSTDLMLGIPMEFKSRSSQERSTSSLSNSGITRPLNQRRADSCVIGSEH